MDYLHAFGYARSQSVRSCYLRFVPEFCMHFRPFILRLISDKFGIFLGMAAVLITVCHSLSRRFPTMPKI